MLEIIMLLESTLRDQDPESTGLRVADVLPILTASLGTIKEYHVCDCFDLFGPAGFNTFILDHIVSTLNLEEKPSEKPTRIRYEVEEMSKNVEKEIKLLCRMVELSGHNLELLEEQVQDRATGGLTLVVLLCKMFRKIAP
jgi:hypothetical protein